MCLTLGIFEEIIYLFILAFVRMQLNCFLV